MKKFMAFVFAAILSVTCAALAACTGGEDSVSVEEVKITAPASTEIKAGEKFTLEYTILPAEAAEGAKVEWEISDSTKLSYANGEFTAHTCGDVTVTAHVKDSQVTDKIELKVTVPEGYTEFTGNGYSLVYPSKFWFYSSVDGVDNWDEGLVNANGGTNNINVTTDELNEDLFAVTSGEFFETVIEAMYSIIGITVNFEQPTTVEKSTYLGVERLEINYVYSITFDGVTGSVHQTQVMFNNKEANLTCTLTLTFAASDFDDDVQLLQQTIISQFMPA